MPEMETALEILYLTHLGHNLIQNSSSIHYTPGSCTLIDNSSSLHYTPSSCTLIQNCSSVYYELGHASIGKII